ncbi:MAG: hypothetical protein NTW60_02175 [Candidatus Wolfebacteria bacterium]|nr:hypothetical protein [Candidatus Wolfebacteria bacterium]
MDKFSPEIHKSDFNGDHRDKIEAGEYEDQTELVDSSRRLEEIAKMKKDTSVEIYRLKSLIAAGGGKIEPSKNFEDDLVKLSKTIEALMAEESEIRRNLTELN